jgi:hypothetical protein
MHLVTVAMAACESSTLVLPVLGRGPKNSDVSSLDAVTRATLKSFNPPASLAFTGIAATRLVLSLFDSSNSISNQATGSGIFFWKARSKRSKRTSPSTRPLPPTFSHPSPIRPPVRHFRSLNDSLESDIGAVQQDTNSRGGGGGASATSRQNGTNLEIIAHPYAIPKHITISTSQQQQHASRNPTSGILVHSDTYVHCDSEIDHIDSTPPRPILATYPPIPSPTSPRRKPSLPSLS